MLAEIVSKRDSRVQSVPDTYTYTRIYYMFMLHVYISWYFTNSIR